MPGQGHAVRGRVDWGAWPMETSVRRRVGRGAWTMELSVRGRIGWGTLLPRAGRLNLLPLSHRYPNLLSLSLCPPGHAPQTTLLEV